MLSAQSLDQLDVLGLLAVGGEHAEVGLAPGGREVRRRNTRKRSQRILLVQHLGDLVETAGKTVVDEGSLEDLLEGREDVELLLDNRGGHGGLAAKNKHKSASMHARSTQAAYTVVSMACSSDIVTFLKSSNAGSRFRF